MSFKRNKGFTLVELLIAVLILVVTIGGVLLLYVTSMISSQLAWDTTVRDVGEQKDWLMGPVKWPGVEFEEEIGLTIK